MTRSTGGTVLTEVFMIGSEIRQVIHAYKSYFASLLALLAAGFVLFPIVISVMTTLKTQREYFSDPLALPQEIQFENYIEAWTVGGFQHYMVNSFIVVTISLTILIVISLLATYALMHFDIPYKTGILLIIIAGFMIPPEVMVVPIFTIMNEAGWINQYRSLISIYVTFSISFSVFFLVQYFSTISDDVVDAARADGCSELQVLTRIYVPMSIPAITTILVFQFVVLWNEFMYALLMVPRDSMRTAPAGLMALRGGHTLDHTLLATGAIVAAIPTILVFLVFRNHFVRGFTFGQMK